jgi:hypothetical protein
MNEERIDAITAVTDKLVRALADENPGNVLIACAVTIRTIIRSLPVAEGTAMAAVVASYLADNEDVGDELPEDTLLN